MSALGEGIIWTFFLVRLCCGRDGWRAAVMAGQDPHTPGLKALGGTRDLPADSTYNYRAFFFFREIIQEKFFRLPKDEKQIE